MKSRGEDFKITGGIGELVLDVESLRPEVVCGYALVQENLRKEEADGLPQAGQSAPGCDS